MRRTNNQSIDAVFVCNTPLHVYNAMQAIEHFGLNADRSILVLKKISDRIKFDSRLTNMVQWKNIVNIDPFPVNARMKEKGNKKRIIQWRFFKTWQNQLLSYKGCQYVFVCHNRQEDNKVIASYINARELVWLEDGTLSYYLWMEDRSDTPEKKVIQSATTAKPKTAGLKKPAAKTAAPKKPAAKTAAPKKPAAKTAATNKPSEIKLVENPPILEKNELKKPVARRTK